MRVSVSKCMIALPLLVLISAMTVVPVFGQAQETVLQRELDSLFVIASSGELRFREMVEPAIEKIAGLGAPVVPLLIDKFTTKSARERLTIINILKKIGLDAVPDLVAALDRTNGLVVQRVCWALGDIGDTSATVHLIRSYGHGRWQVRDQAIGALGKTGDMRAEEVILEALADSIGQVRKAAAVAAGKLKITSAVDLLITRLGDSFYGARMSAVAALLALDTITVVSRLGDSFNSESKLVGDLACYVLGQLGNDEAMEILLGQVRSPNVNRRTHAALAIIAADPYDNCGYHRFFLEQESDRLARIKISSALADIVPFEAK